MKDNITRTTSCVPAWFVSIIITATVFGSALQLGFLHRVTQIVCANNGAISLAIYGALTTAAMSMLAFEITAVTLIVAFGKFLAPLADEGFYPELIFNHKRAMLALCLVWTFSFAGLILGSTKLALLLLCIVFWSSIWAILEMIKTITQIMSITVIYGKFLETLPPPSSDP